MHFVVQSTDVTQRSVVAANTADQGSSHNDNRSYRRLLSLNFVKSTTMESEPPTGLEPEQQTPVKKTSALTLEDAHDELDTLVDSGRVTCQEVAAIQHTLKEHSALREKVSKLKSLLGRSAKAQRESKLELEQCQRKLRECHVTVDTLSLKVEKLQTRPTHMDLLADFESNFDRALLSKTVQQHQSGGQDTSPQTTTMDEPAVDTMLLQELSECKARMDTLETLNANTKQRSILLEQQLLALQREKEHSLHSIKSLQLELRMAHMETEHATRSLQDKTASVQEMQLEIDLLTQASASVRAAHEKQVACGSQKLQIAQLQKQVQALQEWACASAEAKSLAMEHVQLLEQQLSYYRQTPNENGQERILQTYKGSLVIGAGDVGYKVLQLESNTVLEQEERIVLRWKFDLTPAELSVVFSLFKGVCDSSEKQSRADYLIQDRCVLSCCIVV